MDEPTIYRLRVGGTLDSRWSDWFAGLAIAGETDSETILEGPVPDQAALRGILERIWDLNLTLIAVERRDNSPGSGGSHA